MTVDEWRRDAACANLHDDGRLDFYSTVPAVQRRCLALCRRECPVRQECLTTALGREERWGTWGGITERGLREALAIDELGETHDWGTQIRCPNCTSAAVDVKLKRRVRVAVECTSCDFRWERRRVIKPRRSRVE